MSHCHWHGGQPRRDSPLGVQHRRPVKARVPQVLEGTRGRRLLSASRPDMAMMHHKPQANRYRCVYRRANSIVMMKGRGTVYVHLVVCSYGVQLALGALTVFEPA